MEVSWFKAQHGLRGRSSQSCLPASSTFERSRWSAEGALCLLTRCIVNKNCWSWSLRPWLLLTDLPEQSSPLTLQQTLKPAL